MLWTGRYIRLWPSGVSTGGRQRQSVRVICPWQSSKICSFRLYSSRLRLLSISIIRTKSQLCHSAFNPSGPGQPTGFGNWPILIKFSVSILRKLLALEVSPKFFAYRIYYSLFQLNRLNSVFRYLPMSYFSSGIYLNNLLYFTIYYFIWDSIVIFKGQLSI